MRSMRLDKPAVANRWTGILGWHVDCVHDGCYPFRAAWRTVNVWDNFRVPDVELVFPLSSEQAIVALLGSCVSLLQQGFRPQASVRYEQVLPGGPEVTFAAIPSTTRRLRVILSDRRGRTDFFAMSYPYSRQWLGTVQYAHLTHSARCSTPT